MPGHTTAASAARGCGVRLASSRTCAASTPCTRRRWRRSQELADMLQMVPTAPTEDRDQEQDDWCAVVVKPQGCPTMGSGGLAHADWLLRQLEPSAAPDSLRKPRPCHRLDAGTGGLVVLAKTTAAVQRISEAFVQHQVQKRYRALVWGRLEVGHERRVDEPLHGLPSSTLLRVAAPAAATTSGWVSTVDLWPLTGRTHQLRKHMKFLGCPILGDRRYGGFNVAGASGEEDSDSDADAALGAQAARGALTRLQRFQQAAARIPPHVSFPHPASWEPGAASTRVVAQIEEPGCFQQIRGAVERAAWPEAARAAAPASHDSLHRALLLYEKRLRRASALTQHWGTELSVAFHWAIVRQRPNSVRDDEAAEAAAWLAAELASRAVAGRRAARGASGCSTRRKWMSQGYLSQLSPISEPDMYYEGEGCKKDIEKAAKWYGKSADNGRSKAQYNYAMMLQSGKGVEQDPAKAAEYFEKAAEQGFPEAAFALAVLLDGDQGIPEDKAGAKKWYTEAAVRGHVEARSHGVAPRNPRPVKALELFEKAGKEGHKQCEPRLACPGGTVVEPSPVGLKAGMLAGLAVAGAGVLAGWTLERRQAYGLRAGGFILLEYVGHPNVMHERLVIFAPSGQTLVCTLTPDDDSYEEDIFGVIHVRRWLPCDGGRMGAHLVAVAALYVHGFRGVPMLARVAQVLAAAASRMGAVPALGTVVECWLPSPIAPPAAPGAAPAAGGGVGGFAAALALPPAGADGTAAAASPPPLIGRQRQAEQAEQAAAAAPAGAAGAAPADARIRPVSFDLQVQRHVDYRTAVMNMEDWPVRGPATALWTLKFMEAHGGTPTGRHSRWLSEMRLAGHEPSVHEHEMACRTLERMVVHDQLNVANPASGEMLARAVQLQEERHRDRVAPAVDSPNENAHILLGTDQLRGNACVAPALQEFCKEELRKQNAHRKEQRKAREEHELARKSGNKKKGNGDKGSGKDDK
ncbi:unnamed protein product [Prorocentrum cordatum]|uniref:Pseudouridine synthase RsuA/RluA-like domain-containing protein n=1 Tax=Prorocentrum cordatum TaxID=2364126 RepID=A0ABN9XAR6_9DINO|nr:unnamed protein product [Polarella glacialis]